MDFGETLLAAQRNQQDKANRQHEYYRTKFEPPKKEARPKDKLSANIQKFLAKKEEEERRKQVEVKRKRDELLAMRDPKATKKIQKMLKVIKSANKAVIEDAVDRDNTAVTREGANIADQDDYGYESQEAAALYRKMMEKYSKLPDEEKFPASKGGTRKDLESTKERMKQALKHEDEPVEKHRRHRKSHADKDDSPPPKEEPERKPEKPKIRKPMPPPLDFNALLKIAEQKKSEPMALPVKKEVEQEPERLMTKTQKRQFEEEQARKMRRMQNQADSRQQDGRSADNTRSKYSKEERLSFSDVDRKRELIPGRIPKIGEKASSGSLQAKSAQSREQSRSTDRPHKENIELKSQNTYRIEKTDKRYNVPSRNGAENYRSSPSSSKQDGQKPSSHSQIETKQKSESHSRLNSHNRPLDNDKKSSQEQIRSNSKYDDHSSIKTENKTSMVNHSRPSSSVNKNDVRSNTSNKVDAKLNNGHTNHVKQAARPNEHSIAKQKLQIKEKQSVKEKALFGTDEKPRTNGMRAADDRLKEKYRQEQKNKLSQGMKRPEQTRKPEERPSTSKPTQAKKPITNSFDFDKHVSSLGRDKSGSDKGKDLNNKTRQGPPSDLKRKAPNDLKKPPPKRRVIDSEDEYDSELDDFIDDSEANFDYSKHIKELFGYDKSRYRDSEDDVRDMESSFAQVQREEFISKKIGIMEDLEDMRLEAMEKAKKKRRRVDD